MSGQPALMVLYDTDAVEVRCVDGSRLELSPCGATMIFQPALKTGDHPRQGVSSRVHKRTCFVTSDHKKLVLQTLDFRNRFAVRPYLCEELLNKDDLLTLYATVDLIRWPDSSDYANVEILTDGSRKITSHDDFATLVVSPHGQDFSVSYLSRISFDDKGKESHSQQFLQSSNMSYCLSKNRTELSSAISGDGNPLLYKENTNEAIVQPFQSSLDDTQNFEKLVSASGAENVRKNAANFPANKMNNSLFQPVICEEVDRISLSSDNDGDKTLTGDVSLCLDHEQPQLSRNTSPSRAGQNNESLSQDSVVGGIPLPSPHTVVHNESITMVGSPTAHDISSISRSSTPDGLRTTIDSDATLIHDHNEVDPLVFSRGNHRIGTFKHHRHSSPTHCSSPFDDVQKCSFVNQGASSKSKSVNQAAPPSLDGSYLGIENRRHSPVGQDEDSGDKELHQLRMGVRLEPGHSTTNVGTDNVPHNQVVNVFGCDTQQVKGAGIVDGDNETTGQVNRVERIEGGELTMPESGNTKTKVDGNGGLVHNNNTVYAKSQTENVGVVTMSLGNNHPESGTHSHLSSHSHSHRSQEVFHKAGESFTSNSHSHSHPHEQMIGSHNMPQQDSLSSECVPTHSHTHQQHSVRAVSSVLEEGQAVEEESACRKKYVWVTAHASRNACPREWTHPLMLALKAGSTTEFEKKPPGRKERYKQSILPKPLPLTCPFQHKHRMNSLSNQGMSDDASRDESLLTTSIGEFQQGRLKVVVSEGIIYRLTTSCNELTVVEVYPGDGTVLVSQGVKAIFFTHYIPRNDMLEERTYSLKSLPPGCAKGRHSIEKMMKTANRLVQICLSWDKRCGTRKSPCWQKEIVAVVAPLSSSLLEECTVNGLGRFSAFTNGRVRILFDDRTALDTVADFKPRLGNVMETHQTALYTSESGTKTARLLVTSGNYVTVEMNKPGPYARYLSVAKEWVAWVNASQTERQEFYKQQNQPHVIQQAAELELKKIFCFNYILEHTAGLSTNTNPRSDDKTTPVVIPAHTNNNKILSADKNVIRTNARGLISDSPFQKNPASLGNENCPSYPHSNLSVHPSRPQQPYHPTVHSNACFSTSSELDNHTNIVIPSLPSQLSSVQPLTPFTHNNYNTHQPQSSTPIHPLNTPTSLKTNIMQHTPSSYNPIYQKHTTFSNTHKQHISSSPSYNNNTNTRLLHYNHPMPNTPSLPSHHTHHPMTHLHHEDKCVDTSMGFQSVRSALARTSSLINDIDLFLEDSKS